MHSLGVMEEIKPRRVCIVVLGDVGRSPRMSYHALSFAESKFQVELVGYKGAELLEAVKHNNLIQLHYLSETPNWITIFPRLLSYIFKTVWQFFVLSWLLLSLKKCDFYVMQNPPATPTLPVLWMVCLIKKSQFVIDWHNYGHTVLSLSLGKTHSLVQITSCIERYFGRKAAINLCVSNAMKKDLADRWNIKAVTVYDRPADLFKPISVEEQHEFFKKISKNYPVFGLNTEIALGEGDHVERTMFTEKSGDNISKWSERPALIVSSTSWTEDEDFSVLLSALENYEAEAQNQEIKLPKLMCVITGKGPMKECYLNQIANKTFNHINFCMPWLEPEDYPKLLACADLGICLHTSTSGLDLPMKIVDMFGCKLPVCAIKYESLSELVKHDVNGFVFENASELKDQLKQLLSGFPEDLSTLNRLRGNLEEFIVDKWSPYWKTNVLPIFSDASADDKKQN